MLEQAYGHADEIAGVCQQKQQQQAAIWKFKKHHVHLAKPKARKYAPRPYNDQHEPDAELGAATTTTTPTTAAGASQIILGGEGHDSGTGRLVLVAWLRSSSRIYLVQFCHAPDESLSLSMVVAAGSSSNEWKPTAFMQQLVAGRCTNLRLT